MLEANIRNRHATIDYALTKEDCCRVLDKCTRNRDKALIAILIESLQRIGTVSSLTWGDVNQHLDKGEEMFLVRIDPKRTKRNVEHWMPIGKLSAYHLSKYRQELRQHGIQTGETDPIFTTAHDHKPMNGHTLMMVVERLMAQANVRGRKQNTGYSTRYEKRVHDFRKFGAVEMQKHGVDSEVRKHFMGQTTDAYTSWLDRYDDLLEIYKNAMPQLSDQDTMRQVVDFAKSLGFNLDPKAVIKVSGNIKVDTGSGESSASTIAGA